MTFAWTAPATGGAVATYVVEVGTSSGASNVLNVETGGTTTTYSTTLGTGTYYARVRARNSAGTSGPSNEVILTVAPVLLPPGPPSNLIASVSVSTVSFSWSAPTTGGAPTTYILEVGSSPGASNVLNLDTGSTATSYSTPATAGIYYARVRARNSYGLSGPSNEVTFVVAVAPGAPSNLSASRYPARR